MNNEFRNDLDVIDSLVIKRLYPIAKNCGCSATLNRLVEKNGRIVQCWGYLSTL